MKKHLLFALVSAAVVACNGDVEDQNRTKAEVAQAIGSGGQVDGDVCTSSGWNEDGFCDPWCPDGDVGDCGGGGDDVVCATFIEESDGVCGRSYDDPCIDQDPDCVVGCNLIGVLPDGVCEEPTGDPCWYDPDCETACAEYMEMPNGVCERPANDPCIFQDPDCDQIACPAIAEMPDGICDEEPGEVCPLDPDCPWNQ